MATYNIDSTQAIPVVSTWHVPPACQGQMVEIAYGIDDDGYPWRRTTDLSDRSVSYQALDEAQLSDDSWQPWNREPSIEVAS